MCELGHARTTVCRRLAKNSTRRRLKRAKGRKGSEKRNWSKIQPGKHLFAQSEKPVRPTAITKLRENFPIRDPPSDVTLTEYRRRLPTTLYTKRICTRKGAKCPRMMITRIKIAVTKTGTVLLSNFPSRVIVRNRVLTSY